MAFSLKLLPRNELTGIGRRACSRSQVWLSASLMTTDTDLRVLIRDISSQGAMIDAPVPPPLGSYVTLRREAICAVAQVVWVKGRTFGLQFAEIVEEPSLLSLKFER